MESEHTMIVGEGATLFAQEKGDFLFLISDWLIFWSIRRGLRTKTIIFKGWNWSKKQV